MVLPPGPDLNPIRLCSLNMWELSHKLSGINVRKLSMNSALHLYIVLLLLPVLRYGFLNLEALCNFESSSTRTQ